MAIRYRKITTQLHDHWPQFQIRLQDHHGITTRMRDRHALILPTDHQSQTVTVGVGDLVDADTIT